MVTLVLHFVLLTVFASDVTLNHSEHVYVALKMFQCMIKSISGRLDMSVAPEALIVQAIENRQSPTQFRYDTFFNQIWSYSNDMDTKIELNDPLTVYTSMMELLMKKTQNSQILYPLVTSRLLYSKRSFDSVENQSTATYEPHTKRIEIVGNNKDNNEEEPRRLSLFTEVWFESNSGYEMIQVVAAAEMLLLNLVNLPRLIVNDEVTLICSDWSVVKYQPECLVLKSDEKYAVIIKNANVWETVYAFSGFPDLSKEAVSSVLKGDSDHLQIHSIILKKVD